MRSHVKDKCGCRINTVSGGVGVQNEWEGQQTHVCDGFFCTFVVYILKVCQLIIHTYPLTSFHM